MTVEARLEVIGVILGVVCIVDDCGPVFGVVGVVDIFSTTCDSCDSVSGCQA